MGEASFYCLLFFALYLFLKYRFSLPKKRYLIYSALLITCSFGFRFEAILYPILLTLFLLKDKDKNVLFFFPIASFLPVLWFVYSQLAWGHPFFSFISSSSFTSLEVSVMPNYLDILIRGLLGVFPLFFLLLFLVGFVVSIKGKKIAIIHFICMGLLTLFAIKVLRGTLFWQERYVLSFAMFFPIYISIAILYLLKYIPFRPLKMLFVSIVCFYAFFVSAKHIDEAKWNFLLDPEIKYISRHLSGFHDSRGKIIVDVDEWHLFPESIIVHSSLDPARFRRLPDIELSGRMIMDTYAIEERRESLLDAIENEYVVYILYAPEGRALRWLVPLSGDREIIGNARYTRIFKGQIYWIYRREEAIAQGFDGAGNG